MVEQYLIWALLVGMAIGAAAMWFALGRLPRRADDVSLPEIAAEAEWISASIEGRGGVAPAPLVEEVLELHVEYVSGEPLEVEPYVVVATTRGEEPPAEAARRPTGEPRDR
ncbi:hypothetical protein BH23CHL7_BH23CHL7_09930 [soil metagenome]